MLRRDTGALRGPGNEPRAAALPVDSSHWQLVMCQSLPGSEGGSSTQLQAGTELRGRRNSSDRGESSPKWTAVASGTPSDLFSQKGLVDQLAVLL